MLAALGGAAFLILIIMMIYLGSKLETLEDQLAYQPPVTAVLAPGNSAPLRAVEKDANTIYVPVYSHIYAKGGKPVLLETTLSVRNTDPANPVTLTSIRYFDTQGELVQEYLDGEIELGPLESTEVLVQKRDSRGGSGANFIITWHADNPVHHPLAQAVMVGNADQHSISFLSAGRRLGIRISR